MMSMFSARLTLAGVTAMLATALLGGCAAGLDKDQCRTADWRTIGYEDGLHGLPADRIGVHRVACAKHQVAPNLVAYTEGRERGIQEYCQPRNAFRVGLNGRIYANVCSGMTEPAFLEQYRDGREIYVARAELRATQARLQAAMDGLVQIEAAVQNTTTELIQPRIPITRRVFLTQELVRLAEERSALEAQVSHLTLRTREMVTSVRELERQSAHAL